MLIHFIHGRAPVAGRARQAGTLSHRLMRGRNDFLQVMVCLERHAARVRQATNWLSNAGEAAASSSGRSRFKGSPSKAAILALASVAMSTPAAISQTLTLVAKYPSSRPAAT